MPLSDREKQEIAFWREARYERPDCFTVENLVNKMGEAPVFLQKLRDYRAAFDGAGVVLEVGAGQGWASCMLKRQFPNRTVLVSDISVYAAQSVRHWERVFSAHADGKLACTSYQIPLRDASVDLVFCFASAHHFGAYDATLREIRRVLKPGGKCLFLHEPACRRWCYSGMVRRANRIRAQVPEDVVVFPELLEAARRAGFADVTMRFAPTLQNRGPLETVYYWALSKLPFLQGLLPCSSDFVFTR